MEENISKSVGRPKLFSDEYYKNMSIVFGNGKRKIQNAHYWSSAMSTLSDYNKDVSNIVNLEYLFDEDLEKSKQCVLVELGRLHKEASKYCDYDTSLNILVTVTKNICDFAKSMDNNLRVHDAEQIVRDKKNRVDKTIKE